MPTISISIKDLESLLDKPITPTELESLLRFVKGEIKEIEKDELKIELADTNRPDLWCVEGIARQLKRGTYIDYTHLFDKKGVFEIIVEPEIKKIRPYIGGFIAKEIEITESSLLAFIQVQEKLADGFGRKRKNIAIGVYNAQKIEFPIFYRAVAPESKRFVPLEFSEKLNLKEILTLHPKGKEYGYILKGASKFPYLEDSQEKALSFPPIINSRITGEVIPGDNEIFCEVTGTDIDQLILIINILAANLIDRGAKVYPCIVKYPYSTKFGKNVKTPHNFDSTLIIGAQEFERLIGEKIGKDEIKDELEKMGYTVEILNKKLKISVPPYRKDVMHPVDVIEDFAISVDYNSIKPTLPTQFTIGKSTSIQPIIDRVKEIMIGCGFEEVMTNVLVSKRSIFSNMNLKGKAIEISNPISDSYTVLRNSIIPSLLEVEAASREAVYPHRIFEIGEIVIPDAKSKVKSKTQIRLASLIAHPSSNFSELNSFLNNLAYYLGFSYRLQKTSHPSFIKGRVGNIVVGEKSFGIIGEIHPQVLENWKIKYPVTVFELSYFGTKDF